MARDWQGISQALLPDVVEAEDFVPRLRSAFSLVDDYLRNNSFGMARISLGEQPDGSGDPIGGTEGPFFLLAGRSGGQFGRGDTGDGGNLKFSSTFAGVKGRIYLGEAEVSAYDEANQRLGIGTASPSATLHVSGSSFNDLTMRPAGASTDPLTPWRGDDGGTDLGSYIGEVVQDDTRYIKVLVDGTVGQISARIPLTQPTSTPSASNTHTLRATYRRTGSGGIGGATGPGIDIAIYKNGVVVTGSWISVAEPAISGSFTTATVTLSAAQITGLGDYSGLEVWCNWTGSSSGVVAGSEMQVSWAELDCGGATTLTEIARLDDGGVGLFPAYLFGKSLRIQAPSSQSDNVFEVGDASTWSGDLAYLRVSEDGGTYLNVDPAGGVVVALQIASWSGSTFAITSTISTNGDAFFGNTAHAASLARIDLDMDGLATYAPAIRASNNNGLLGATLGLTATQLATSTSGVVRVFSTSNLTSPTLVVNGNSGATARIVEFNASANTNFSYIGADGSFNGPVVPTALTVADNVFRIAGSATPTKLLAFEVDGLSVGTRTLTPQDASYILAGTNIANTFSKQQNFTPDSDVAGVIVNTASGGVADAFVVMDTDTAGVAFSVAPSAADVAEVIPITGIAKLKLWPGANVGTGFSLLFVASSITADRSVQFPDTSGIILLRTGNTINTTGRTTSVATANLVSSPTTQLYQINAYMHCSTAGDAGDKVDLFILWDDGSGVKTQLVLTLSLTAVGNFQSYTFSVYHTAGTNLRYSTTLTSPGAGTPAHSIRLRATALG